MFFQVPGLPEAAFRYRNWFLPACAMMGSSRPGPFTAQDMAIYREAWNQPGSFSAMLNWYRAAAWSPERPPAYPRVGVPAEIIWGAMDRFLGVEMAHRSADLCDRGTLRVLPDATHWVHHQEPEIVNRWLCAFLSVEAG